MGAPVFVRLNYAIHYTFELYEVGKIYDYAKMYEQKQQGYSNYKYLDDWDDFVLRKHKDLEDEIWDVINHYSDTGKTFFFDELKSWLTDVRIKEVNYQWAKDKIDEFNERQLKKFAEQIKKEEIDFKAHPDYSKREHLEKYTEEPRHLPDFLSSGLLNYFNTKQQSEIKTYYKYNIVDAVPDVINTDSLKEYVQILKKVVNNLKGLLTRYVSLFDAGKLISVSQPISTHSKSSNEPKLLELPKLENHKIKVKLSVPELLCLFKLLHEQEVFNIESNKELYKFISENFSTPYKKEQNISIAKLNNLYTTISPKSKLKVVEMLRKMISDAGNI